MSEEKQELSMDLALEQENPENANAELIFGLQMLIDHLENHPEIPALNCNLSRWCFSKADFLEFARTLGSYKKTFDDSTIKLTTEISPRVSIEVYISRDQICKSRLVWDCPDDVTSLLKGATER